MPSQTQIVCLCEGQIGNSGNEYTSIDLIFINRLIRSLKPSWVRKHNGSKWIDIDPCGGRSALIQKMPSVLKQCIKIGSDTTLMVWADCDANCADGEALKQRFWVEAQEQGITPQEFDQVVFIFAKYRLENWIEFLNTDSTDESQPGPRIKKGQTKLVAEAAKTLATKCQAGHPIPNIPPSLEWSCDNWRTLAKRMT